MLKKLLAASALTLCLVAPAQAQDVNADPIYETVTLSGGFTPDPYVVNLSSGGTNDASKISPQCDGFVATSPDVRLNFQPGSLPLYISATSDEDTTLVINAPDGNWYCDDDSGGDLNPMVSFDNPMTGRYEIWVGTYGESASYPAQLNISEISGGAVGIMPTSSMMPDINAEPIYATVNLSGGFTPDPYTVNLSSGGTYDANNISQQCAGYIANSPDVRLNFQPGSLPLYISANSSEDTTLVVNAPDGNWYCNDDGGGNFNPLLAFDNPLAGRYEIWVGTYGDSSSWPAQLNISEIGSSYQGGGQTTFPTPMPPPSSGPDINAEPIYETVALRSGFSPDPYIVRMSSGGGNDASNLSHACAGFIASSPDVRLNYDAGSLPLYISASSMADTTLVINAPDGNWYCDDDSGQGTNPSVRFQTPLSGRYEIWVGTYGEADSHATELNISELYSQ